MSTKNYALSGVASEVELGKRGSKLKNNAGVIEARKVNNDLAEMKVADATTDDSVVTLRQLKKHGGLIITGQIDGSAPPVVVDGANYIVTIAGGTFPINSIFRGENGIWVLVPIQDGYPISIADSLTGGTKEYLANHIYNYDAETSKWMDVGPYTSTTSKIEALTKFALLRSLAYGANYILFNDGIEFKIGTLKPYSSISKIGVKNVHGWLNSEINLSVIGKFQYGTTEFVSSNEIGVDVAGTVNSKDLVREPNNSMYPHDIYLRITMDSGFIATGEINGNNPPAVINGACFFCTTTGGAFTHRKLYKGIGGVWVEQLTPIGTQVLCLVESGNDGGWLQTTRTAIWDGTDWQQVYDAGISSGFSAQVEYITDAMYSQSM